ncbi:hypothetical protein HLB35_06030 [Halomonas sp. TBZ9]|uniref:ResB-like domain-containing protein n=1 Tax=Vreelandella azerica TaxID=2732867 RepID=A0A7Y3TWB2_9GAMM|nr:hypothetical protein [Halomonas azerica]NOG31436.1 hypothetical protein [Halomonas azerica]
MIPGGFVLDFFPHSDKYYILEVYTLDVKENEDASRVFVVILNKLPLSVSNITGFVSQYSPFPSGILEKYFDIEKNRITFFLPDEPVFIFNSMWSLLWLAICLGGVLFTFEDYSNYLFKIRVGKIFSKRLVKYKVDRLESFSSKYNFKNRCVRDGVIKILSFFND